MSYRPYRQPPAKPKYIDGVEHWLCPGCHQWIPHYQMGKRRGRWNGLDIYCKECKRKREDKRRKHEMEKPKLHVPESVQRAVKTATQPPTTKRPKGYEGCQICDACARPTYKGETTRRCQDCSEPITDDQYLHGNRCDCCTNIEKEYREAYEKQRPFPASGGKTKS